MINKAKELFFKYEEIIVYLIVGVMTTIVSWACDFSVAFLFFAEPLNPTAVERIVSSTVNWTSGVAFAYPLNRKFVFKSKDPNVFGECSKFVLSRVSTYILDIVVVQLFGLLGVDLLVTRIISAVLVVIGNYIFSKLVVFRKK